MTAREVVARILNLGGYFKRQVGSHARYGAKYDDSRQERECSTTVPMHKGDIPTGTRASIERAMEPAFGKGVAAVITMYRASVRWDGKQCLADVVGLPGAHTYARTVDSLRKRLREVVVLMADLPDSALEDSEAFHVSLNYTAVVHEMVGQASKPAAPGYDELRGSWTSATPCVRRSMS